MSNPTSPHALLASLADRLGVGPLVDDEDHVSVFSFEGVDTLVASDDQAFTLFARLGEAPRDDAEFLESLLAANLFWQDTAGATLSLEPFSRMVILAVRQPVTEIHSVEALESAIEVFAQSAMAWMRTIERLHQDSSSGRSNLITASELIHRA